MMYSLKVLTACIAIGLGLMSSAYAENFFLNGIDLYKSCTANTVKDCKMYLVGVLDGRITYMNERAEIDGAKLPIGICIYGKKDRTIDDLRRAVIKQIDSNHDRYDEYDAGLAVVDAIKASFPCDTGSNNGPFILKK